MDSNINQAVQEELEVLEAIYPDELTSEITLEPLELDLDAAFTEISDRTIELIVEPEERVDGASDLILRVQFTFPDDYPDVVPEVTLEPTEGDMDSDEETSLLNGLQEMATENLGAAMTFTLVTHLRETIAELLKARAQKIKFTADEKERLELEAEEARTRGTAVTPASFADWSAKFAQEAKRRRGLQEEERLRGLTAKEKDEWKKSTIRLSGRQLFERDRTLANSDASLLEEGAVSVDVSQYERSELVIEEEGERLVNFDSDSD